MNLVNINIERPNFDKENSARNIEVMNRWISDTSDKLNYLISLINAGEVGGTDIPEGAFAEIKSEMVKMQETAFDSTDTEDGNASEWTNVEPLKSGEKDRSILEKISQMFRNVRYLFKVMGNTDISSIGGGTATGAINYLKQNLEKQSEKIGSLNADLANKATISDLAKHSTVIYLYGAIFNEKTGPGIATGTATVVLNGGMALIFFDATITTLPSITEGVFAFGINVDHLRSMNSSIPVITAQNGGVINYTDAKGTVQEDLRCYGGCFQGSNGSATVADFLPARIYTTDGGMGGWDGPSLQKHIRMDGVAIGTY